MNFKFPGTSFLRRALVAFAFVAGGVFSAVSLLAAPLVVVTEPGAYVFFEADGQANEAAELGKADDGGLLILGSAPGAAGTITVQHPDAVAPLKIAFSPAKNSGKIVAELKLRPAVLIISALPADETEIFVDGVHRGRGSVTLGDVVPRKQVTVEVRSPRRGMQSRVVTPFPGESMPVKFDLRGNEATDRPDGQIVLPELPLVLASQEGATIKADGVNVSLEDGSTLRGLEPGERVIEIFLPWRGRTVCVWRGAMPARSATLPGADVVAMPNPVRDTPAEAAPAETQKEGEFPAAPAAKPGESGFVLFSIGSRVNVSLGSKAGMKDGAQVFAVFGEGEDAKPVPVTVSGVTESQCILQLPEGTPVPADDTPCRITTQS